MTHEKDEVLGRLLRLVGPRAPVPDDRARRVRAAVQEQWRLAVRRDRRRRMGARAAAAALAASVVLAFAWWRYGPEPAVAAVLERTSGPVWLTARAHGDSRGPARVRAGTWIETGKDGRAALRLSGGASLRLDVASRVRLVSASRIELEQGAVYVDSALHDGRSQVSIETPYGVARDIGTQFELRLQGDALRLRVREGRVDLAALAETQSARQGEELRVEKDGGMARAGVVLTGPEWGWTQAIAPEFALEGRPLQELLDWYTRETHVPIQSAALAPAQRPERIVLHGGASGLSPEEALTAVLPTCGLKARASASGIVLESMAR
jgi:ferric-dicitrate binding protein FerR (iron transport regulator)